MKNRIYYFSGTGNCFKLAKDIANQIGYCELVSVSRITDDMLPESYERIGFVFPVYFLGLPLALDRFLERICFKNLSDTYFFAVATYGALVGNALPQLAGRLKQKGISLDYGAKLIMFSNAVTIYDMSKRVQEKTEKSNREAAPIIEDVCEFAKKPVPSFRYVLYQYYKMQICRVHRIDHGFQADPTCTSCGICKSVCPVGNITIENRRPVFHHQCEHCTACIQYCPEKSLNYKNKTQKRRRYHHPQIDHKEIAEARKGKYIE